MIRLGNGRVAQPTPLSRVVILGMGQSVLDFGAKVYNQGFGWQDPETEVWTLNKGGLVYRHHRLFNMHDLAMENRRHYWELYRDHPTEIVTLRAIDELPMTTEFPLAEALEEFGVGYIENGVSYMILFALMCFARAGGLEGKSLHLYGCDYHYGHANLGYEHGKANVEHWLGFATAKGVKVHLGMSTTLCDIDKRRQRPFYGYGDVHPVFEKDSETGKLVLKEFKGGPE